MGIRNRTTILERLGLPLLTCAVTISFLLLFWHVRISIRPSRWPPVDSEWKDDERGHGLVLWELLVCCLVPTLAWKFQLRLASILHVAMLHGRKTATLACMVLCLVLLLFRRLAFPPKCQGWIRTDVGYIQGHEGYGHNMHTICNGNVWEPHVADAISDYLYGQGRAIDVGAFIGYHTLRLAKHAAPFDVYAFEGRDTSELQQNVRRNNAKNVKIRHETIDSKWKLDPILEEALLEDETPLALVKIDCEGCELNFLQAARSVLKKWHPVIVVEIQNDERRQGARLGGQRMILPTGTRGHVLQFLRDDLGYTVTALADEEGNPTWDYLALRL